ncbi:MAG: hypothetical protein AAGI37_21490 [Planctomycetota bacterium]
MNQDIKANVLKHERPEDAGHMRSLPRRSLRERQRQPEKVKGYFKPPTMRYAAEKGRWLGAGVITAAVG